MQPRYLKAIHKCLGAHTILAGQIVQKIIIEKINLILYIGFQKFCRHEQRGSKQIGLAFGFIGPFA
jgi:hypothetical protein